MKATIFEIKRFAVHDGDGIRTTVFFKGCPLRCLWCHNPEGLCAPHELAYFAHKCISCGECAKVCPTGAHRIESGTHTFEREKCIACGKCAEVCFGEALTLYGKEVDVTELLPKLLEDRDFYKNSGGGVTVSGGECLIYAPFVAELLKALKENGIHTAVDTSGFVSREALDCVIPYTDVFLYDIKAIDSDVHKKCTAQDSGIIIENLHYLDSSGKSIEVRIPFVPDYNDGEISAIAELLSGIKNLVKVRVLAYHNYAGSKYAALGAENHLPDRIPTEAELADAREKIRNKVRCEVV